MVRSNLTKKAIPWVRSICQGKKLLLRIRSLCKLIYDHIFLKDISATWYSSQTSRNFPIKQGQIHKICPQHSKAPLDPWKPSLTFSVSAFCHAKEWEAYQKQANILHWIPALPIYMENKGLRLDPTLHQSKYLQWPPICPLNWSGPGASVPLPINGGLFLESRGFVWPPGCGECSRRSLKPATSPSCNDKQKMHFLFSGIHWLGWWLFVVATLVVSLQRPDLDWKVQEKVKEWIVRRNNFDMKIWQENNTERHLSWSWTVNEHL